MSWSIYAMGKPAAVAAKVREDSVNWDRSLSGLEQSVKTDLCKAVAAVIEDNTPDIVVKVSMSGSSYECLIGNENKKRHSVTVTVETIDGFLE